ncbi:uncharacterized protein [Procambarus clarkii]|uniref:uncharacterized protein n=1 Tax=Procambarus clarkii TaxID=6728 RepID=UPI003744B146
MCWLGVLALVLVSAASSASSGVPRLGDGRQVPQPLMGTVVIPAIPSTFPFIEFTDYGIQSHLAPLAEPPHLNKGLVESSHRSGDKNSIMEGSVPINAYLDPLSGLARHSESPAPHRPLVPVGGSVGATRTATRKEALLPRYSGGAERFGGYGGMPFGILDPTEEDVAQQGTLQAALHTLWAHRNDVYITLEETGPAAVNRAWLDILNTHHPHTTTHHRADDQSPAASSTKHFGHNHSYEGSPVGVAHVPATPKPSNYGSGKLSGGQHRHSLILGGHYTLPHPRQTPVGRHGMVRVRPPRPGNIEANPVSIVPSPVGFQMIQASSKQGGNEFTQPPHSSGVFGLKSTYPKHHQRLKQRPSGSQAHLQMVKRRLLTGPAGSEGPGEDSTLPATHVTLDHRRKSGSDSQDLSNFERKSIMIPSRLGKVQSSTLTGHQLQPSSSGNTQSSLTSAETPLEKKMLISSGSKSNVENGMKALDRQGGGNWMVRMGKVVSGMSNQLPSLEKAITTMSFLAFGVFMANLLVQALANSTSNSSFSLNSLLGREDVSTFSGLPLDLSALSFDFGASLGLEKEEEDDDGSMLKKVADIISQVYISLHDMARAGLVNMVSALGLGMPTSRTPPWVADQEPECVQRLLCEGHNVTSPYFKSTVSYRLLPFWTMGASWLSGEANIPRLLEELRAELAGQQGLDCGALFPECTNTATIKKFIAQVESELANSPNQISENDKIGQGMETGGVNGYFNDLSEFT